MSSTVTKPGSGNSIVRSAWKSPVQVTRMSKLPVKPSGTPGISLVTMRLPNSGGMVGVGVAFSVGVGVGFSVGVGVGLVVGVGVGFSVGVGVGVPSVQFSEFDLLEEITVVPSSLTAKTTRIPPEVAVNGAVALTV